MRANLLPLAFVAALAAVPALPTLALAQTDPSAAALSLFEQGRQLVAEGKLDQACPKFVASEELVPKVSTLLNLADCYERSGKLASAWARFSEAAALANREGQGSREGLARDRAAALAPRLAKLTVAAGTPVPGTIVKRDGVAVDPAAFGSGVPVDAGTHLVEASAPGFKPWSTSVRVADGASVTVTVPRLEAQAATGEPATPSAEPAPAPPAANRGEGPPATTSETADESSPSPPGAKQRTIGLVVGGAGVAALAAGGVFFALAASAKSAYEQDCGSHIGAPAGFCNAQGVSGQSDASTKATVSTVLVIGGALAAAGGAILFFTAPRDAAQLGIGPGAVVVRGSF